VDREINNAMGKIEVGKERLRRLVGGFALRRRNQIQDLKELGT
jgi:hypothetical protein